MVVNAPDTAGRQGAFAGASTPPRFNCTARRGQQDAPTNHAMLVMKGIRYLFHPYFSPGSHAKKSSPAERDRRSGKRENGVLFNLSVDPEVFWRLIAFVNHHKLQYNTMGHRTRLLDVCREHRSRRRGRRRQRRAPRGSSRRARCVSADFCRPLFPQASWGVARQRRETDEENFTLCTHAHATWLGECAHICFSAPAPDETALWLQLSPP